MDIVLKIFDSNSTRSFFKRATLPCVIGRSRTATIIISHPLISRRHCEVLYRNGAVLVRDLDSLNGTWMDKKNVGMGVALLPGQAFSIGDIFFELQSIEKSKESAPLHVKEPQEPSPFKEPEKIVLAKSESELPSTSHGESMLELDLTEPVKSDEADLQLTESEEPDLDPFGQPRTKFKN